MLKSPCMVHAALWRLTQCLISVTCTSLGRVNLEPSLLVQLTYLGRFSKFAFTESVYTSCTGGCVPAYLPLSTNVSASALNCSERQGAVRLLRLVHTRAQAKAWILATGIAGISTFRTWEPTPAFHHLCSLIDLQALKKKGVDGYRLYVPPWAVGSCLPRGKWGSVKLEKDWRGFKG